MEKKKFLFVSNIGLCVDIAWQVKKEGHDVKFYIKSGDDGIGSGFFDVVESWESEIEWADVVFFDDVEGFGTLAKRTRAHSKLVFGGTPPFVVVNIYAKFVVSLVPGFARGDRIIISSDMKPNIILNVRTPSAIYAATEKFVQ